MRASEDGGLAKWAKYMPRQGTGIVGRLSTVACVAFAALGAGVYSMPGETTKLGAIVVIAVAFLVFVFRMLKYAEDNPLHASLEGEELLQAQLKQWEMAARDQAPAVPTTNVEAPKAVEQEAKD